MPSSMRFIELHKITRDRGADASYSAEEDAEPGESQVVTPIITSVPVWVNVAAIRNFYQRKNDRPGTRITFTDGGGYAVTELVEEVMALIGRAA